MVEYLHVPHPFVERFLGWTQKSTKNLGLQGDLQVLREPSPAELFNEVGEGKGSKGGALARDPGLDVRVHEAPE